MAADGSIIIDTSINDDGFVAGTKELEAACRRTAAAIEGISAKQRIAIEKSVNAFAKQNEAYAQQEAKVAKLKTQMAELSNTQVETDAYKEVNKEIENLGNQLAKAEAKKKEMLATGGSEASKSFQKLEYQTEQLTDRMERALSKKKELEGSGGAYQAADTSKVAEQLAAAETKLSQMRNSLNISYAGLKQKFSEAMSGVNGVASASSKAATAVQSLASKMGGALKKGLTSLGSLAKKAATGLFSIGKASKSTNAGLGSSLKTIIKATLGIRGLFALVRKLKSALIDGMQNLAQYSDSANASISAMKSSISTLKNSVAAAFAPILSIVAPVVTKLINLLATAISYIGAFFAALSGQRTFTKAVAVQEDYASSLGNTAKAAGAAGGALKELADQTAGIDELNVVSENSGGGGGGGGGGAAGPMFEEAEIPGLATDWADKFKEAWKNADFTEIGTIVGTKLKNALDNIPWADIQSTCNRIAKSIATFINGFVATPGLWETVGKTIGNGINTAVGMWNTFFDTVNFVNIGKAIATALNNAIQTIDFYEFGKALSQKFQAMIEMLYGFVTEFDWGEFGLKLSEGITGFVDNIDFNMAAEALYTGFNGIIETINVVIKNTDWNGIAARLGEAFFNLFHGIDWTALASTISAGIIALFDAVRTFIASIDWYQLGQDVKTFLVNLDWNGIADSVFSAIGAAFGALAEFIRGLIGEAWQSVVDWWHEVAYEDGHFTISGLLDGIGDALKGIGAWIKQHIFQPFIDGFKSVFGIHSPSTVMAEQGGFIVSGLLKGISGAFGSVIDFFGTALGSIQQKLGEAWETIKTKSGTAWGNIKETVKEKFESAKTSLSTTSDRIKTKLSTVWDSVKEKATTTFNDVKTNVSTSFGGLKTTLSTKTEEIKTELTTGFETAKENITGKMQSAMDIIKQNDWGSVGTNICTGIGNGISKGWETLKTTVSNLAKNLLSSAKSALGIHSPSRLFRDEIGYYIGAGIGVGIEDAEPDILRSVNSVTDEMQRGFLDGTSGIASFTGAMDGILDKLQAISDTLSRMGSFRMPEIASGTVIPYAARVTTGQTDTASAIYGSNGDVIAAVYAMADRIVEAVTNHHDTFMIGDEQIVRSYDRGNQKRGVRVSSGAFANAY